MEINCLKTKKVVAYVEGKICPRQTVTIDAIQVASNWAKVKQIYMVDTYQNCSCRENTTQANLYGGFQSFLLHVPLPR